MQIINSFVALMAVANTASAFWRMPCRGRTGAARLDPIMDPGTISDHVHTFHGGNAIHMSTDYDDLRAEDTCTSCGVMEDKSAYWTPTMHFMWSNGTSKMVTQVGGMLAYYLMYLEKPENLEPFPAGFQMIAGNRNVRNFTGPVPDTELSFWPTDAKDQFFLQQRAVGFNCLNYKKNPEPSLYRHQFPEKDYMDANCADGIRLELAFPSCGTGATDSHDHKSHMAYPSLVKEGNCPPGYDHKYPFLFFETIWATNEFAGEDGYFTLSHGDPIGTGYHGDFIMGWDEDFLKQAINTCTNDSGQIQDCPIFTIQDDSDATKCTFDPPEVLNSDDCLGPREGLANEVPIQWGKEPATMYPVAGRDHVSSIPALSFSKPTGFTGLPTFSYTEADPSVTATAQGGIIVAAAVSSGALNKFGIGHGTVAAQAAPSSSSSAAPPPPPPVPTSAPVLPSSEVAKGVVVSTTYITKGNEVIEMVIEQVDVTITASLPPAAPTHAKRHLHKHGRHDF